jgi:hypothetical protein
MNEGKGSKGRRVVVGDFFKSWRRGQKIKEDMILCNFLFFPIKR